jgi:pimeloyl-ACP methyl ester carboxylesterase
LDLGIERPIVIGHSWGTLVALALALDFPQAVGGLVLLSGFYRPTLRADVPLFSVFAIPAFGDLVRYTIAPPLTEAIMPRLIERCFAPLPVPERFAHGFPRSMAVRPSQIRAEA